MNNKTIINGIALSLIVLTATSFFFGTAQTTTNSVKKINAYDHSGNLISSHYAPDVQYVQIEESEEKTESYTVSNNGITAKFEMIPVVGTDRYTLREDLDWSDADKSFHIKSFLIGETEVTQELWKAVMGDIPQEQRVIGNNYPIIWVSYNQICGADGFLDKLNRLMADQLEGMEFCLPTEAEWEYAANGGIFNEGFNYSGSESYTKVGHFKDNDSGENTPIEVKSFDPNILGIYDMSGNVQEWCSNSPVTNNAGTVIYSNNASSRGGSYYDLAIDRKIYSRSSHRKTAQSYNIGFRLALKEKNPEKRAFSFTYTDDTGETHTPSFNMIAVPGIKSYSLASPYINWSDEEKAKQINPFFIGETEVTNILWKVVMDDLSSTNNTTDFAPATQMTWNKICGPNGFLEKLNEKYEAELDGWEFCLPNEWEWEWAARGASPYNKAQYCGSTNIDEVAWYAGNSSAAKHVKTKKPNALGIYDMSGNVWEFIDEDNCFKMPATGEYLTDPDNTGTNHTIRGGGYNSNTDNDRCKFFSRTYSSVPAANIIGFRLALKKK